MKKFNIVILCAAFTLLTGNALAQQDSQKRGNTPPPEAIKACEGKSEGDTVSFETRRGDTLEGTCKKIEEQLVAVPANGGRQGPKKD
ncbi:hypothetical protein [Paraglaciecola hydrolytica]|uniref:Secreted protein n=1 Tax=Paraglaciecola hydrolytica TaxID=1799789 RepID=A0A136A4V5_9ALTE|nr:hypothetical protein [Paraglaciecola hydrolytica]KXI30275.1 hypothetical protein AX660_09845 [Paraglaciecola hydrolytica]